MSMVNTESSASSGLGGASQNGSGRKGADGAALTERPQVDPAASGLITAEQAVRLRCVPYAFQSGRLMVAMVDPLDLTAADEVSVSAGCPVTRLGVSAELFGELLRSTYGTTASQMAARLAGESEEPDDLVANLEAVEAQDLHRMAEQPSLINLVNLIILEAIRARASDVHVEPFEKQLKVKYRVDGMLLEQDPPPKHLQPAITSRIKIMAGMNIAERYAPQDGHITLRFEGRKIDIRVSTVPTLYGESVVMRILDKEAVKLDLETLGMRRQDREVMDRLIGLPHGMVLVTGPTGSGKTTTLYAALSKLYDPSKKIITIEDPVEYELTGVNQIPVNPKRGLTFASGLRHILRQDPDVIMVGEIRDAETAEISVRAALTGHLLFSTLHTNDASSAIGRLLDMGIEPFLLSSVLEAVLAQRLGRRICQHCRTPVRLSEEVEHRLSDAELAMFAGSEGATQRRGDIGDGRLETGPTKSGRLGSGPTGFRGAGCDKCDDSGCRGRVGFYELLVMTPALRRAVSEHRNAQELLRLAGSQHVTMRRDGLIKAAQGLTTVEEVLRATQDTDTEEDAGWRPPEESARAPDEAAS